jgi:SP family xylose:H+ symportor-like MFS transporter
MFNMQITDGDNLLYRLLPSVATNFGHWFTYGLYGVMCIVAAFFVWKMVPETKGKSLEDMTRLWKRKSN